MNKVRPTSELAKQMCEDVGPYQHHDISILGFVHHIWGLDRSIAQKILDMDLKLDPRALYAYRRSECSDDLYAPFTGFAKILHGEVVTRLNKGKVGEASVDEFWEEVETGNLMTTWVAHTPSDDAEVNLGIAKHILEFNHDRYKDTGSFLTQSQRARMKTDTFTSGPNQRPRAKVQITRHRGVNSERCRASPEPQSSSESDLPLLHPHNRKRRRRQSHSSSDSHRPAKRQRRFDDTPHLLDSAIECMSITSRRWVTGLLIDTCEVTACYFDRHMVVCSESFRFDRDPSVLALVVYAMSRCDRERAGFDPYHVSSPLKLSLDQRLQGDVELPVEDVVGSFFDFTFRRRGECVDDKALGSHVPLKDLRARCEQRKDGEGEEGEEGNKDDEGRDKKATESKPDTDHQDAQHISPHRSTCFRVVDFIHQPNDDDLITRGTTVYKVQRRLSSGKFSDDYYALKFSWAMKSRLSEIDAIQHLRTALPESSHDHLPDLLFSQSWTAEQLRLPWLNLKLSLNEENHRERVLRVFASRYYKKVWQAGSVENFKQAWLDCVEVCHLAFRMGKVLHQDLSENNIMVLPLSGGGVKGVVNDWDMAKFVQDQKDQILDSGRGTGTPPFMAREFLYPGGLRLSTPHWFRHDLESLFYVLIWAAIQYNIDQGTRDEEYHPFLESWTEHAAANSSSKAVFIAGGYKQEDALLAAVKPEFKQVAEEWILPLRTLFRNAEFYGDQKGDPNRDPCTYGGRLTFKTFMKAINVIPRSWGIANYLEDD